MSSKNEPPRGLTRKPSDPLYDTDCPVCKGEKRVLKTFRSGCCGNRTMLVKCPSCRGTGRRKE